MQSKKPSAKKENEELESYNPTSRNFQRPNADNSGTGSGRAGQGGDEDDSETESEEDAVMEELDPTLDEEDLEENDLSDEEADDIEWDPSGKK